ncbi:unnamed protein product [Camellia sinensis]
MASLLDGMANTGMVELGEVQLATYLFKKIFTGQPSFHNVKYGNHFCLRVKEKRAKTPALVPEDADPIWSDDEDRPNRRRLKRAVSNQDRPPSITDTEPKDAYQMPLSNFDSE